MLPWHINNIFIIVFPFQHFIFFYPMVFIYKFIFHQRNNDISTTESKRT